MEFTINRVSLMETLRTVNKGITANIQPSILKLSKLVVSEDSLKLLSTRLDVSVEKVIMHDDENKLDIQETGELLLDSNLLSKIVMKMAGDTIKIKSTPANNQIGVSCGKSHFNISTKEDGYPTFDNKKSKEIITIGADKLHDLIDSTLDEVSTDESRPLLQGIHILIKDYMIKAVATDSHILGQYVLPLEDMVSEELDMTIKGKDLKDIIQMIGKDANNLVSIYKNKNQLILKSRTQSSSMTIYTNFTIGNYPETDRLMTSIPESSDTTLNIGIKEFTDIMNRGLLAGKINDLSVVNLHIGKDAIHLSTHSGNQDTFKENMSGASFSGADKDISFNPAYVLRQIKKMDNNADLEMKFQGSLKPFIMYDAANRDELLKDITKNNVHLTTPVRTFQ